MESLYALILPVALGSNRADDARASAAGLLEAPDTAQISAQISANSSPSGSGLLLVAAILIGVVAVAAIASVLKARRETQSIARIARNRATRMGELMRTIRMAEQIAGLGIWQYDPATGAQQWSHGMRRLFGLNSDDMFMEGDAETLLYAHDIDLIGNVSKRASCTDPYTLTFDILDHSGQPQTLSVEACNLRGRGGEVTRIVAVLRDITDEKEREREIEFSRQAAIKEARRARDLAGTDPLTGLANRRRVMSELDQLLLGARKNDSDLVLVTFDLDHFKRVNDTYGHPQGDKVLKRVAHIAVQEAREGDVIGRVGGEEFVWILPGAGSTLASKITERLREAMARGSSVDDLPAVTASIGYAALQPGDTSLTLFARADQALYQAKNSGRNMVCMAA